MRETKSGYSGSRFWSSRQVFPTNDLPSWTGALECSRWVLFFFPLWWKGNYSPLPQHLPQCFRDHSASFRDKHFTYNPSASFRDLVFVVLASATTVPLRFLSFFHFGLALWAFICFHFWPFSFATFVCLGLGLCQGIGGEYGCLGMWSFRGASAKLPRGFRETPKQNR